MTIREVKRGSGRREEWDSCEVLDYIELKWLYYDEFWQEDRVQRKQNKTIQSIGV